MQGEDLAVGVDIGFRNIAVIRIYLHKYCRQSDMEFRPLLEPLKHYTISQHMQTSLATYTAENITNENITRNIMVQIVNKTKAILFANSKGFAKQGNCM